MRAAPLRAAAGCVALALVSSAAAAGPGSLPQTTALPRVDAAFRAHMRDLWRGIVSGSVAVAVPAFFPRGAYLQAKAIADPGADYEQRLIGAYRSDIAAAHRWLGAESGPATFVTVRVPEQWAWIPPGACYNKVGYWHDPGARLVYRIHGHLRSIGISSLISWRGEWYVVHLAAFDQPGTVYEPSVGIGSFGPAGGC